MAAVATVDEFKDLAPRHQRKQREQWQAELQSLDAEVEKFKGLAAELQKLRVQVETGHALPGPYNEKHLEYQTQQRRIERIRGNRQLLMSTAPEEIRYEIERLTNQRKVQFQEIPQHDDACNRAKNTLERNQGALAKARQDPYGVHPELLDRFEKAIAEAQREFDLAAQRRKETTDLIEQLNRDIDALKERAIWGTD